MASLADEFVKLHTDLSVRSRRRGCCCAAQHANLTGVTHAVLLCLQLVQRNCGQFASMLLDGVNPTSEVPQLPEVFTASARSR